LSYNYFSLIYFFDEATISAWIRVWTWA